MENKLTLLTEEQFDKKFKLVKNHIDKNASFDGKMFETFGLELEYVLIMAKENRVVTIIEGEDVPDESGEMDEDGEVVMHSTIYYASGYHLVNRLGFLIVDKPITEDFEIKID